MIENVKTALHALHDVQGLIQWGGLTLICAIVFTETGLFFGFFLPGDSLLVTAGVFARMGHLDLFSLLTLVPLCAIVGDQVGYLMGRKAGQALYKREDSTFFKKAHLLRTREFYEKYGAKTIVIARFVPIVRTFAPVVAGIGEMEYKRFITYNIAGGLLWVFATVLGGYGLASLVPDIDKKIHSVIIVVIVISVLPAAIEIYRERTRAKAPALSPKP